MKLDQFLTENKISTPAFAASIEMDPSSLWRIRKEKVRPDWKTIDAIVLATNGAVMPNDFLPSDAPSPAEAAE